MSDLIIKRKKLKAVEKIGSTTNYNIHASAACDDWIRAGRLAEAADDGDIFAADKLAVMNDTGMSVITTKLKKTPTKQK